MNRKSFFKRLFLGAAAIAVAPKILAEIKPEPIAVTWAEPNVSELLAMQKELMNNIMNIPISQWGSLQGPPYRTGGVIQYIAECNQGLHPPELCDYTTLDFSKWTSQL